MLNKYKVGSLALLVGVVSFGCGFGFTKAYASLISVPSVVKSVSNTISDTKTMVNEKVDSSCSLITSEVETKQSSFDDKYNKHLSYFKDQRQKLQLLSETLSTKGLDTNKLRSDLVLFDLKQRKFEDDKAGVVTALSDVKSLKCAGEITKSATAISNAVQASKVLMTDTKDLLDFLNKNIQGDVEALHS